MITPEQVATVSDDEAWTLLKDVKFYVYGTLHQLYTVEELSRKEFITISKDILKSEISDNIQSERGSIYRSIENMVSVIEAFPDVEFELVNPRDSFAILASIERFLVATRTLVNQRAVIIDRSHLRDFYRLGILAEKMFKLTVEITDIDEGALKERENSGKMSFFDLRLTNIADDASTNNSMEREWVNPFQGLIDGRLGYGYSEKASTVDDFIGD